ncbi:MAG: asparagine synthase (glutamine-hydrolyzing) [Planctomycetes bacterium]|nr:asparagine synthase (glutamine-hydrolyzing) [Planctomycetota bacterium]
MCGITGFFSRDPAAERRESELIAMGEVMRHRGPDAHGSTVLRGVGLHNRRLAILDLSPDGNQPMYSPDGTVALVFNGEIFNWKELRAELEREGVRFKSQSDTEVLVYLWLRHRDGDLSAMLARLNGFFALAIHDRRDDRLFIARDRMGVKPLHYAETARGLVFGSQLKTLLAEGSLARELDPQALLDFLCVRYVPAPRTIWKGARKLPAGHYLLAKRDGRGGLRVAIEKWWDLPELGSRSVKPEAAAEELWELLVDSVRRRMIADVPLGAFLSGGLDSSAVVAAMAQSQGQNVHAITIGFKGWDQSEVEHARIVAQALKIRHTVHELDAAAIDLVDPLAEFFDEPFSDPSAIPTWLLAREARKSVTVALAGDGGDECFAGYRRYRFDQAEHRVRSLLPGPLFQALFKLGGAVWPKGDWLPRRLRAKTTLQNLGREPAAAYFRSVSQMDVAEARALLHPDLRSAVADHDPSAEHRRWYDAAPAADSLGRALYADFHTWLPEYVLAKTDRATMAVSLEAREPLLDWRLVEFAAALPSDMKLREGVGKWLFKRAAAAHLPAHTIARGKQGFAPPLKEWVKRELAKGAPFQSPRSADPVAVAQALARHRSGLRDLSEPLYALRVLSAFERRWLDPAQA